MRWFNRPGKDCSTCQRIINSGRQDIFYQEAVLCQERCTEMREKLISSVSDATLLALDIHTQLANQVIVAGMGEIIGINHLALHEYLRMMEFSGVEYRYMFKKVVEIDRMFRKITSEGKPKNVATEGRYRVRGSVG